MRGTKIPLGTPPRLRRLWGGAARGLIVTGLWWMPLWVYGGFSTPRGPDMLGPFTSAEQCEAVRAYLSTLVGRNETLGSCQPGL